MTDLPVKITGNVPDKTMGRLGEAIADLISPITETTGLIGDSLRFHREQMAERRISAARAKAESLGIEVKKLPYKFIVGWLEASTLENENSPLNDLWENLLVAGMTSYENYMEMFVSILRELDGSEVNVLKQLADRSHNIDRSAGLIPSMASEGKFPPLFQPVYVQGMPVHDVWVNMVQLHDETSQTSFQLLGGIAHKERGESYYYHPLYHDNFVAFELLTRERLVDISKCDAPWDIDGHLLELITAKLTQLGISFVRACMFPESLRPAVHQG